MKVLLLSIKTGFGHHSAAQALSDCLTAKGARCEIIDAFEYILPVLSESVSAGYLLSTKFTPTVYGKMYALAEKHSKTYSSKFSMTALFNEALSKKLIAFIQEYAPDVIVCTHVFASQIVTYLKEFHHINAVTIGIVTDFKVHPFWEKTNLDYYVTANEQMYQQMEKKGIEQSRVLPFGIPIKGKFSHSMSKQEARSVLNIDDRRTILFVMGSMGYGNMVKYLFKVDHLNYDLQIICVCGRNEKLKKSIDKRKWNKKIYNYGFVDNIDIMMDAADCIVTKPGGLTTSEALAKKLPLILMNPIPGQEDRNVEFLVNNGAAMLVTKTYPLDEAVYQMFSNDWRLKLLSECVEKIGKPDSAQNLCDFILQIKNDDTV